MAVAATAQRRERAPRGSITRERVVAAGLELIDEHGLERLTMPRLAERLNVGTMSLYRHVRNKAELIDAIAERIFSELLVPETDDLDWREPVVGYLLKWRSLVHDHPSIAPIIADRALAFRTVYDQLEEILALMRAAGFDEETAVRGFYALFTYVLGFVVWELPHAAGRSWQESLPDLPRRRYRALHELSQWLLTTASEDQFRFGLDTLVGRLEEIRRSGPTGDRRD